MMGVVGLGLLIACVNLANLLLAQSPSASRISASPLAPRRRRSRLVRQP